MNGELRIKNLALASELAKQLSHGFYGLEGLTRIKRIVAGYTEISAFFRPKQVKIALIYLVGIHYFPSLLKICVICEICERLFAQTLKTAVALSLDGACPSLLKQCFHSRSYKSRTV